MIVYGSLRIPFTRYTLVDEDQLLDQIELVQFNLPKAFDQAAQVVEQRDEIILDTKEYAQELILAAEQQAADILDEMTLVQQAKLEAQQIRLRVQQECEAAKADTLAEIDSIQTLAQRELEEMRRAAIQECEALQQEADDYADGVLREMEDRLTEMLRVIRNGRQQLYVDEPPLGGGGSPNRTSGNSRSSDGARRQDAEDRKKF